MTLIDQETAEALNERALDESRGGVSPSYSEMLQVVLDRTEDLTAGGLADEYLRGQLEMIADLWAKRGVETPNRVAEIKADLRACIEGTIVTKRDLRYDSVTLLVPHREGRDAPPEDWNWTALADSPEPIFMASSDPMEPSEVREILRVNGFGEQGDLADQIAND